MSKAQEYWDSLSRFDRIGLESFREIVTCAFEAGYEARRAKDYPIPVLTNSNSVV